MPIAIGNQNTPPLGASVLAESFRQVSGADALDPKAFATATNLKPQSFNKAKAQEIAPTADPNVLNAVVQVILGLIQLMGASTTEDPKASAGIKLDSKTPTEEATEIPEETETFASSDLASFDFDKIRQAQELTGLNRIK
jgi:hypothetical protein